MRRRFLPAAATLLWALVLLAGPADPARGQAAVGAAQQAAITPDATVIHPGDALRLTIFREPEWSGTWTVPTSGVVVFPRIGERHVAGMQAGVLRELLRTEYARYLLEPSIEFDVHRKVQILGAVRNPNIYNLPSSVTISDALAVAGGITPEGRSDRVELRRDGAVVQVLLGRTPLSDAEVRSGDQLFVPERSYVSRNAIALGTALSAVVGLIVAIAAR
jgi:protein involved in polysaccharide export with SLBB domain